MKSRQVEAVIMNGSSGTCAIIKVLRCNLCQSNALVAAIHHGELHKFVSSA
jgi:hypothetical protein